MESFKIGDKVKLAHNKVITFADFSMHVPEIIYTVDAITIWYYNHELNRGNYVKI